MYSFSALQNCLYKSPPRHRFACKSSVKINEISQNYSEHYHRQILFTVLLFGDDWWFWRRWHKRDFSSFKNAWFVYCYQTFRSRRTWACSGIIRCLIFGWNILIHYWWGNCACCRFSFFSTDRKLKHKNNQFVAKN